MNALKRITLATLAATALGPLAAQAVDITVQNNGNVVIHPYFRSNCWNPDFSTAKNEWVFFGGILPHTQFTWGPGFETLGDPACRNPYLEFTYVEEGEAPLDQASARPTRVVNLKAQSLSTTFVIRLKTGVMIDTVQQSN